jgi:hypothetical protein
VGGSLVDFIAERPNIDAALVMAHGMALDAFELAVPHAAVPHQGMTEAPGTHTGAGAAGGAAGGATGKGRSSERDGTGTHTRTRTRTRTGTHAGGHCAGAASASTNAADKREPSSPPLLDDACGDGDDQRASAGTSAGAAGEAPGRVQLPVWAQKRVARYFGLVFSGRHVYRKQAGPHQRLNLYGDARLMLELAGCPLPDLAELRGWVGVWVGGGWVGG